jgi:hypothetical protein
METVKSLDHRGSTDVFRFVHHPAPSIETLPHSTSAEDRLATDRLRRFTPMAILACLIALVLICFGSVLFRDHQFAFRDAAHYYYPLYERVHQEWNEGRWPLWEPEENSGMPLLGNPTAAVLYPGQILYRILPYAWGARLYIVAHSLLAFAGMLLLVRSWGTSATGSALAALSYAFGAPILFQYCNVIYLVGAAWTPWGFWAVDRWLRRGRRRALLGLAVVLAMQTLGGDPESSYILGICAGGYALGLAWLRSQQAPIRWRWWLIGLAAVAGAVVWIAGTIALAAWLLRFRVRLSPQSPPLPFRWMPWVAPGVVLAWGLAGFTLVRRDWRLGRRTDLATMLVGLGGAAILAGVLSAAQLLPVLEFTRQSGRAAGEGPHDIYPFSLEPNRLAELIWPNLYGTSFGGNRSWLPLVPPRVSHARFWVPSLYVGGLTLLFALSALGFRDGPPWRAWLSAIAVVSLVASLGAYTSPIYWARLDPSLAPQVGPLDPENAAGIRHDGFLRDGDGGFYWFLSNALPGFKQFRFPSKLLGFTALAVAGLAGIGWDRLMNGQGRRRLIGLAAPLLAVSLAALIALIVQHDQIMAFLRASSLANGSPLFGPFDFQGAWNDTARALVQTAVVFAIGLALAVRGPRRTLAASLIALTVMTGDLALANARYVLTLPQKYFETKPKVLQILEVAERERPAPGPFRVHRLPIWNPFGWLTRSSIDRPRDFVVWERDSIQPKYAIPYRYQYTLTLGVAEIYDYEWFFGGFLMSIDADMARELKAKAGQKVVVFPRKAFDLWNTRYFVVPVFSNGWADENRGYASFLPHSERIYPPLDAFDGPGGAERQMDWAEREDFQVFRNEDVYPRAWIVHDARYLKPVQGMGREERDLPMQEMLFNNDPFWHDSGRVVYNPRELAWIDQDRQHELFPYFPGKFSSIEETVTITHYGPQRVELDARLVRPGLVVLADIYYPGWRLTIDGAEAPIYRANRMMRGAAVRSGKHHLVYTYEPRSFLIGGRISSAGLAALALLGVVFSVRPVSSPLVEERP